MVYVQYMHNPPFPCSRGSVSNCDIISILPERVVSNRLIASLGLQAQQPATYSPFLNSWIIFAATRSLNPSPRTVVSHMSMSMSMHRKLPLERGLENAKSSHPFHSAIVLSSHNICATIPILRTFQKSVGFAKSSSARIFYAKNDFVRRGTFPTSGAASAVLRRRVGDLDKCITKAQQGGHEPPSNHLTDFLDFSGDRFPLASQNRDRFINFSARPSCVQVNALLRPMRNLQYR
ncbi:predicted protein [Histoplasma capsulatum H143]|uniref:Uncharacterized protein n=1 Tax=Ajellomyces capsulatus (strain H143) TaxID=544712 RepID=C6HQJ5_AJECH|nr:predicted protein [Histoplasma capsulatum H143]